MTFSCRSIVRYLVMIPVGCAPASSLAAGIPECGYEVTAVIGGPDCGLFGAAGVLGQAISDDGTIVGNYGCPLGPYHAFLWQAPGPLTSIPMPDGVSASGAGDVTANGLIVGGVQVAGSGFNGLGFFYDGRTTTLIGPPPLGGTFISPFAVNSAGTVVGHWGNIITADPSREAFIWQDGSTILMGDILGTAGSGAADINEAGIITGWMGTAGHVDGHAFVFDGNRVVDLGVIPGGFTAVPEAINNHGQIVGTGKIPDPDHPGWVWHAFFWSDGEMIDLGTLPGDRESFGVAISDQGVVVGTSTGEHPRAFVAFNGIMHDLNDLVKEPVDLRFGEAINNHGQIVCHSVDIQIHTTTVLLSPIESIGDLDGDCEVGAFDLLLLLQAWGQREPRADLDGDGVVGIGDLLILLHHWSVWSGKERRVS